MQETTMEAWAQPTRDVTTKELDDAVASLKLAKQKYQDAKDLSDQAYATVKDAEAFLIALMEEARKEVYIAEGIGRVKVSYEPSVTTPKTKEQKEQFFDWIKSNMGDEAYWAYMTVNSNTLNSLYKTMLEDGKTIAGLEEPTTRTKLSLTKRA